MEYLTSEELLQLLKTAKAESDRDHLMLLFGFRFGLRASEICRIRVEDVKNGIFTVQRLKGSRQTAHPIPGHKGIPLLNVDRNLREWLAKRPRNSAYLFPSERTGKALNRRSFYRLFAHYAEQAQLPKNKRNPHILKHSLVNTLIRNGVDVAYAQVAVGHASIRSTMRYVSLSDSEVAARAQAALVEAF